MVQINDKEFGVSVRNKLNHSLGITTLIDSSMDINSSTLNIGIGTTANTRRLNISGGLQFDSGSSTDFTAVNLTSTGLLTFDSAVGTNVIISEGGDITFTGAGGSIIGPVTFDQTIAFDNTLVNDMLSLGTDDRSRYIDISNSRGRVGYDAGNNYVYLHSSSGNGAQVRVNNGLTAFTIATDFTATFEGSVEINSTGYLALPAGTTAARPGSPQTGALRWNTTESKAEIWDSSSWTTVGGGGGLFKGDNGTIGDLVTGPADIFRINKQNLSVSTTIDSAENASAAGPLTIDSDVTLTVNGNLTIV
jgi:hypothetical protein